MENLNTDTMMIYTNLIGSLTKNLMLLPKSCDQWSDIVDDYLNDLDDDLWLPITIGPYDTIVVTNVGFTSSTC